MHLFNIIAGLFAIVVLLSSISSIIGFKKIVELCKSFKISDLKKVNEPISKVLKQMPKLLKWVLYFYIAFLIVYIVLQSVQNQIARSNIVDYKTILLIIFAVAIIILIGYLLFSIFCLIILSTGDYLLSFIEIYKNQISQIMYISIIISPIILTLSTQKSAPITHLVTLFLFIASISIHMAALYGTFLIIKNVNPFKEVKYYTKKNILIGIFIWLLVILEPIYTEVIICTQYINSAFICSGEIVKNLWDLLYFTLVTFATIGFGDIVPNHPVSKGVTIGIIISSILYLVLFIGTAISELSGNSFKEPEENVK